MFCIKKIDGIFVWYLQLCTVLFISNIVIYMVQSYGLKTLRIIKNIYRQDDSWEYLWHFKLKLLLQKYQILFSYIILLVTRLWFELRTMHLCLSKYHKSFLQPSFPAPLISQNLLLCTLLSIKKLDRTGTKNFTCYHHTIIVQN